MPPEKGEVAYSSLPGSSVVDLYASVTESIFHPIALFLLLVCIYLWPLYLLAAAQARHGQLTRHLFLHHSLSPWVMYLLSSFLCSINRRDTG